MAHYRNKIASLYTDPEVIPPHDPYRALLVAVLERAIRDTLCPGVECKQFEKREAMCWVFDDPHWSAEGLTFNNICEVLNLPGAEIRERILKAIGGEVQISLEGLRSCRENLKGPHGLAGKWTKRNRY